jgi:hypothetical protein
VNAPTDLYLCLLPRSYTVLHGRCV